MVIAGSAAAGVRGVPPAIDKTCCDCQRDEKCEPPARGVKSPSDWLSQRVIARPTKPRMPPKAKPISANRKADPSPKGEQEAEAEKENSREAGHPYI